VFFVSPSELGLGVRLLFGDKKVRLGGSELREVFLSVVDFEDKEKEPRVLGVLGVRGVRASLNPYAAFRALPSPPFSSSDRRLENSSMVFCDLTSAFLCKSSCSCEVITDLTELNEKAPLMKSGLK